MCGIWILLDDKNITRKQLLKFSNQYTTIDVRGPDKQTMSFNFNFSYRFARLSIHDLSPLGDQPFFYFHKGKIYILMINGEIYNYKQIIKDYNLDDKMKSGSDCEVIIHLFIMFGNIDDVLKIIRGEYAFVLNVRDVNTQNATTFVARDPFGVRHLYYSKSPLSQSYLFGSLLKSVIHDDYPKAFKFPSGNVFTFESEYCGSDNYNNTLVEKKAFYVINVIRPFYTDIRVIYKLITDALIKSVYERTDSDRDIGLTLSGGFDSSLVGGIVTKILKYPNLLTYTTGCKGSIDIYYARKAAKHFGTKHTEFLLTKEDGIDFVKNDLVKITETWDVTTNRASIGQAYVDKKISETTDTKVILNGDGADELFMGYMYNHYSPSEEESNNDTIKRMNEISQYDGNRSDKCTTYYGLEGRSPFQDVDLADIVMRVDPVYKRPGTGLMEKQLIRDAFYVLYPDVLPEEILYRRKEAFSNGISGTDDGKASGDREEFFHFIVAEIESMISNEEFETRDTRFQQATTKEGYYYMKKFDEYFNTGESENFDIIDGLWLPSFIDTNGEPSATALDIVINEKLEHDDNDEDMY
jgi:asparagine synthase (glutamine-hydrolysing)